jgi:uncharacterized protein (TIGR03435 family)
VNLIRSALAAAAVAALAAQLPRFEVASITPSNPSEPPLGRFAPVPVYISPGRLTAQSASLKELIKGAYALEDYQVIGGPGWIVAARFDVVGKASGGAASDQLLLMLRSLLADRFKLVVHRETKALAIYALVVAQNGPKFHAFKPGAEPAQGKLNHFRPPDLPFLARYLTRLGSGKPVIDQTGLTGDFDLDLDMDKIGREAASLSGAAGGPAILESMFEATVNALPDELGLKLVPTRANVVVLVIDHVEKPSEN